MAAPNRKSREQEELEAAMRAVRAYERKLQDIEWKHEKFLPMLDDYKAGRLKLNDEKPVFELEPGE